MKLTEQIKPISYLRAHSARIIREFSDHPGTLVITQNGEAKAVVQDIATYELTQESLALLKMLMLSTKSIEAGRHKPVKRAFKDIRTRVKARS